MMNESGHRTGNRWLLVALAVCLLIIGALAVTSWQLKNEVAELRNDPLAKSDRLAALVEEEQEQTALIDPFANPLADPFAMDPFQQLQAMRQQMDELLNAPGSFGSFFSGGQFSSFTPEISLKDKGESYEVVIPVAEDTELELLTDIDNNVLSITGRIHQREEQNSGSFMSSRLSSSQFSRSIRLPGEVDETGLSTQHQQDQVVITVPKETS